MFFRLAPKKVLWRLTNYLRLQKIQTVTHSTMIILVYISRKKGFEPLVYDFGDHRFTVKLFPL